MPVYAVIFEHENVKTLEPWQKADGEWVSRTVYPDIFSAIQAARDYRDVAVYGWNLSPEKFYIHEIHADWDKDTEDVPFVAESGWPEDLEAATADVVYDDNGHRLTVEAKIGKLVKIV